MTDVIKGSTAKSYYTDGSEKPSKVNAGEWPGGLKRIRVYASGENDDSTFGGWFRFETYGPGNPGLHGYVWWKPLEQVKFTLGTNPDGFFGLDGVTRWNFYQVGGDVGVPKENWKLSPSFYGGWGDNGGILTITPTEGLEINWAIPYSQGGEAVDVYMSSTFQVKYTADGLGTFGLTYKSGRGNKEKVTDKDAAGDDVLEYIHEPGQLWVYAGLTMIENLAIDIGFGYTLPKSGKGLSYTIAGTPYDFEGTINDPMAFGLGAKYDAGDFGVKARLQGLFAGKVAPDGSDAYKIPMNIVFDVLPYYNISESLAFLFDAGVDYTFKSTNKADEKTDYAKMGFHIEPYITIKSSWWAPNFYAGIRIETDGKKYEKGAESKNGSTAMNWSVPIGIVVSF